MLFVWRCRKIITQIRSIIILPIKTVHVGVPRWAYFISAGEDYRLPGSTTFFAFKKCWLLSSPLTIMGYQRSMGIYIYDILTYVYLYTNIFDIHIIFSAAVSSWNWGLPPSQMRILWRLRPPTEAQGYFQRELFEEKTLPDLGSIEIYFN